MPLSLCQRCLRHCIAAGTIAAVHLQVPGPLHPAVIAMHTMMLPSQMLASTTWHLRRPSSPT